jgi:hypothetical protein
MYGVLICYDDPARVLVRLRVVLQCQPKGASRQHACVVTTPASIYTCMQVRCA